MGSKILYKGDNLNTVPNEANLVDYSDSKSLGASTVQGAIDTLADKCETLNTNIANLVKIVAYSGTTNSSGNLSLTDYKNEYILCATVNRASTYVSIGKNAANNNMLCFRDVSTNSAIASTDVDGYIAYLNS